jgi:apocytochrome f
MQAYPIYAQQLYTRPIGADGVVVCANCHLVGNSIGAGGRKVVGYDDALFVGVRVAGYDNTADTGNPRGLWGVTGSGERSTLKSGGAAGALGGVVVLPEGFKVLPKERLSREVGDAVKGLFVQCWGSLSGDSAGGFSAFVAGPVKGVIAPLGTAHFPSGRDLLFPILTPKGEHEAPLYFGRSEVVVGAVRGRGQVYPSGLLSGANDFKPKTHGEVVGLIPRKGRTLKVVVSGLALPSSSSPREVREIRAFGGGLVTKVGDCLGGSDQVTSEEGEAYSRADRQAPGTYRSKVRLESRGNRAQGAPSSYCTESLLVASSTGGFGQGSVEVYVQDVNRVKISVALCILVAVTQTFFVCKKKQFEKVQGAERIF